MKLEESGEIVEAALVAIEHLLPEKLRNMYDMVYMIFNVWCTEKNVETITNNVY